MMKESDELLNLLSRENNRKEFIYISAQIKEIENYMKENGIETNKRQLILNSEERFLIHHRIDLRYHK